MTPPESLARARLLSILTSTFSGDGVTVQSDRLNASLGDITHIAAASPINAGTKRDNALVLEMHFLVQVFHRYDPQIDPNQKVDPATIEGWADRFRIACKSQSAVNDPNCWFFNVDRIEYPPDPTGNISRFHAYVTVFGNNTAEV